jgi:hypothetical protein
MANELDVLAECRPRAAGKIGSLVIGHGIMAGNIAR